MNEEIKDYIRQSGIYQWQIAKQLGIHETVFCRWFREKLTQEQKQKIYDAISCIKKRK